MRLFKQGLFLGQRFLLFQDPQETGAQQQRHGKRQDSHQTDRIFPQEEEKEIVSSGEQTVRVMILLSARRIYPSIFPSFSGGTPSVTAI